MKGEFSDDKDFQKTIRYTWALTILRRFHDPLVKTLEAWDEFAAGELKYFETNSEALNSQLDRYYVSLFDDVSKLVRMQQTIHHRIQTFDRMKDAVS